MNTTPSRRRARQGSVVVRVAVVVGLAAAAGFIDNVIEPRETRPHLINALEMLQNKRDSLPPKKHGNIPL